MRRAADPVDILVPLIEDQEEMHMAGARVVLHADQHTVWSCAIKYCKPRRSWLLRCCRGVDSAQQGLYIAAARGAGPQARGRQDAANRLSKAERVFANHLRELQGRSPIDVYALPEEQ